MLTDAGCPSHSHAVLHDRPQPASCAWKVNITVQLVILPQLYVNKSMNRMSSPSAPSSSATTLVSVRNTREFQMALTALTEPCTCWRRITCFPSPRRWVMLDTHFLYFVSGMWWCIRTVRTTRVLHSSQGLQLCYSPLHNTWPCLCLSSADSHIPHSPLICLALRFCHLLQYSLRFGYIPCHCICSAIIVFYMSEIYYPHFALCGILSSIRVVTRCIYRMNNCTQWSSVFTMVLKFKSRV